MGDNQVGRNRFKYASFTVPVSLEIVGDEVLFHFEWNDSSEGAVFGDDGHELDDDAALEAACAIADEFSASQPTGWRFRPDRKIEDYYKKGE